MERTGGLIGYCPKDFNKNFYAGLKAAEWKDYEK
jgi:hypothetical protein